MSVNNKGDLGSRHASDDGVSNQQYNERNTVQALMVTSCVGLLNGL